MSIFKTDTAAKLTAEVDRLTKKRAALASRLVAAESAAAAAAEARRRHLIESDDEDISTGAKFSDAVESAQRDRIAIEDALSELDKLIEEGKAAIVAAKEASARQQRAAEIAAKITKLEPLAATAEKQFETLAATLEKIASIADDDALDVRQYVELKGHTDRLPVTSIIGAALAQAIFRNMPDLLTVEKSFGASFARVFLPMMIERYDGLSRDIPIDHGDENSFEPKPLSGGLQSTIIAPLRAAASEILSGERPLATARPIDEGDEDTDPVFDWRWLVFVKPVTWRDWNGETVTQADSRAMVPEPVAIAALAAGVAVPENSPEAQTHENWRYEKGFHHSAVAMGKQTVTLDVKWPTPGRLAA